MKATKKIIGLLLTCVLIIISIVYSPNKAEANDIAYKTIGQVYMKLDLAPKKVTLTVINNSKNKIKIDPELYLTGSIKYSTALKKHKKNKFVYDETDAILSYKMNKTVVINNNSTKILTFKIESTHDLIETYISNKNAKGEIYYYVKKKNGTWSSKTVDFYFKD